jgi:fermentation-respiration switch protein FrsA (DUF1100 family)
MKKFLKRLLAATAVLYIAAVMGLYFNQRSVQYMPLPDNGSVEEYNLNDTKEIFLTTTDGVKIQTWIHEPRNGKPYIIWLHGNYGNLEYRKLKFRELIDMGFGLIAPSWRGFGKSEGSPSKEGLYMDARAAVEYLRQIGVKLDNTIMIGESLGSGIAVQMAIENKFRGLFLITPYTSIADRAQERFWFMPTRLLLKDNFESIDRIDQVQCPILMVHGDQDEVIPHSHSEKLIVKANQPKELIMYPGKGHSNLDTREIFKQMVRFFNVSLNDRVDGFEVTQN